MSVLTLSCAFQKLDCWKSFTMAENTLRYFAKICEFLETDEYILKAKGDWTLHKLPNANLCSMCRNLKVVNRIVAGVYIALWLVSACVF